LKNIDLSHHFFDFLS